MAAFAAPTPSNIDLSDGDYKEIAEFVHKTAGINLLSGKKELIRTRLSKRMRSLNIKDFKTYFRYVMGDRSGEEIIFLLDSLSTNLTSFFREPQHFDFMANIMLPELQAKRKARNSRRLRIWSAACSSGEEPYTIAMTLLEKNPYFATGGDCKILGTDISTKVLAVAQKGVYGPERVKDIPGLLVQKYFAKIASSHNENLYQVSDQLRHLTMFRRYNLMEPIPFKGPIDLIFCRNVMIYFDKATIAMLVEKYFNILESGGYLFIGHSESLSGFSHNFKYVAPCVYRKD